MEHNLEKAKEFIFSHWNRPGVCSICKSKDWIVLDNVFELRSFSDGNLVLGNKPVIPIVVLMCNSCGYQIMFNAIAVGAVTRPKTKGDDKDG